MSDYKQSIPLRDQIDCHTQTVFILGGIVAFLVYLGIAWVFLSPEAVWSPDTGAKFLQLRNLRWEEDRLAFDIRYPGRTIDPELRFATYDPASGLLVVRGDQLQFLRLPVFPLLTRLWFDWFGFRGLYLLPALGGAASGVLALSLLSNQDRRFAMWVLIAFGSPIYIYATLFWEHTVATAIVLFGAWLAFHACTISAPLLRKILLWITVGLSLGIGAYIRLETLIFAMALLPALWFVGRGDRWGPICAGLMLGLLMLPYRPLHGMFFAGQEMPGHAEYLFYPFQYLVSAEWGAVPDLLIGPLASGSMQTGWLGVLWAIAAVVVVAHSVGADTSGKRVVRAIGLAIAIAVGAHFLFTNTLYHSAHGLLFTTPWALLGLSRAYEVWRSGGWRMRVIVLTSVLGLIGYTIAMIGFRGSSPHGGLEWGARFAMSFYPLLALVAAWDLGPRREHVISLILVSALLFLGLGFQIRGLGAIQRDKQINAALNRLLLELPEQHIVSDLGWFPLNAAPIYDQKQIFVTNTPEELQTWMAQATDQDVWQFMFVTLDKTLLHQTERIAKRHHLEVNNNYQLGNLRIFQMSICTE
jgi:hypothetical protein